MGYLCSFFDCIEQVFGDYWVYCVVQQVNGFVVGGWEDVGFGEFYVSVDFGGLEYLYFVVMDDGLLIYCGECVNWVVNVLIGQFVFVVVVWGKECMVEVVLVSLDVFECVIVLVRFVDLVLLVGILFDDFGNWLMRLFGQVEFDWVFGVCEYQEYLDFVLRYFVIGGVDDVG